jgi:hypothetical protein
MVPLIAFDITTTQRVSFTGSFGLAHSLPGFYSWSRLFHRNRPDDVSVNGRVPRGAGVVGGGGPKVIYDRQMAHRTPPPHKLTDSATVWEMFSLSHSLGRPSLIGESCPLEKHSNFTSSSIYAFEGEEHFKFPSRGLNMDLVCLRLVLKNPQNGNKNQGFTR